MFCISIALKDTQIVWTLLYKEQEKATAQWDHYVGCDSSMPVGLNDDFGQALLVKPADVAGAMLEDLDQSMLAHVEKGLHNARTQAKAETIAMNDPVLKTAAMAKQRGPGIFAPMGNGGMPHG